MNAKFVSPPLMAHRTRVDRMTHHVNECNESQDCEWTASPTMERVSVDNAASSTINLLNLLDSTVSHTNMYTRTHSQTLFLLFFHTYDHRCSRRGNRPSGRRARNSWPNPMARLHVLTSNISWCINKHTHNGATHARTHKHTHTHTHTHKHTHTQTHKHTQQHIYIYTYVHIYIYTFMY